ncbi:MAG: hypothetical protein K1X55_06605 [Chitinophagales bacterium]|nr:hypothetical protein [Chitinophagales bacterium]
MELLEFTELLERLLLKYNFEKKYNMFIYSKDNISAIVRLRKDTRWIGYYIDYGVYFAELNAMKRITKYSQVQLDCVLGNIDIKFRRSFTLSEDVIKELFEVIESKLLPYLILLTDIGYLKENFPNNFDFNLLKPTSTENFEKICKLFNKEPKLPNWN